MSLIYDALKEQAGPGASQAARARASWWARQHALARGSMLAGGILLPVVALAYLSAPAVKPQQETLPIVAAEATATGTATATAPRTTLPVVLEADHDLPPTAATVTSASGSDLPPTAAMPATIQTPATAAMHSTVPVVEPLESAPAATTAAAPAPLPSPATASTPAPTQPISIKLEHHASSSGERRHETDDARVAHNVATLESAMANGDLPTARQALAQLDALLPSESLTLLRMQAWVAHAGNDTGGAEKLYRRIVERVPDDVNAGVNIALLDARRGELDDAHQRLTRLSGRYPRSPQIARALAELDGQRR